MRRLQTSFALAGAALVAVGVLWAQAPDDGNEDQRIFKQLGLGTDGKAVLDYLRQQTFPEADAKQMETLIGQLGDDDFKTREAAYAALLALGRSAIVGLKQAEKGVEPEVRLRAKDLREKVEANVDPAVQMASARLVARLKPDGAAEVLLAFLPFAADVAVTDEVCKALGAVVAADKGARPLVVAALDDKHPVKRGAAAEALARAKASESMPSVRKLLKDPDPTVRVRTAAALVNARDSAAVADALPALIECLKYLMPEDLWAAEDILVRLAGDDNVPAASLGTDEKTRAQCFAAWDAWYAKNHKGIALAKLDLTEPMLGRTLIVYRNLNRIVALGAGAARVQMLGEIVEVDMNKKVLWKVAIENAYAADAMVLPGPAGEVVVAEINTQKVTIRDTKTGKIVWEHAVGGPPINVQALPAGKIMVTMSNRILEIDRATKAEKTLVNNPVGLIRLAKRTRTGDIVYITSNGTLTRVNAKGAVVKQFQVPPVLGASYGGIDILPNGNVLVPHYQQQRVVEYDMNGNQVAQLPAPVPNSAMRLPKGNTLVSSTNASRVTEFNRDGQAVWTFDVEGLVHNARRR